MTPTKPFTAPPVRPPYSPHSDRSLRVLLRRPITVSHIVIAILAIVAALGWTVTSPGKRLSGLDARIERAERRIDTLAEGQRFTNYMLCVNARRTDPASAPPDCAPLIDSRKGK